jgi:hypothetical protein
MTRLLRVVLLLLDLLFTVLMMAMLFLSMGHEARGDVQRATLYIGWAVFCAVGSVSCQLSRREGR